MIRFKTDSTKSPRLAAAMREIQSVIRHNGLMASIVITDGQDLAEWCPMDPKWSAVQFSVVPPKDDKPEGLMITINCRDDQYRNPAVKKACMERTVAGLAVLFKGVEKHQENLAYVMETFQKHLGNVMPDSIFEAADLIMELLSPDEKAWATTTPLMEALPQLHNGFGRSMRNNWHMGVDNKMAQHARKVWKLFGHGDDLTALIFEIVWARLRGEPAEVINQGLLLTVEGMRHYWQSQGVNPDTGEGSIIL
jgi:hypothetical protein